MRKLVEMGTLEKLGQVTFHAKLGTQAERIDRISVFGGLDQVLNGLVTLKQA